MVPLADMLINQSEWGKQNITFAHTALTVKTWAGINEINLMSWPHLTKFQPNGPMASINKFQPNRTYLGLDRSKGTYV